MKTRMILIAVAVATFAWGFAALVRHSDQAIRPENARVACEDWTGDGCADLIRR